MENSLAFRPGYLQRPVLHNQALHSSELPRIRRNQNQISSVGLPRDQRVVLADALALTFERGTNLSSRLRILLGVVQHGDSARKKGNQSV